MSGESSITESIRRDLKKLDETGKVEYEVSARANLLNQIPSDEDFKKLEEYRG